MDGVARAALTRAARVAARPWGVVFGRRSDVYCPAVRRAVVIALHEGAPGAGALRGGTLDGFHMDQGKGRHAVLR